MSIEIKKAYSYSVSFDATEKQLKAVSIALKVASLDYNTASDEYSHLFYLGRKIEEALDEH